MKHVPEICMVAGCGQEASYWIDKGEGFIETLMGGNTQPGTFYLCLSHQSDLDPGGEGYYTHLRLDTAEIHTIEIGVYSCSEECSECNQ